MQVKQTPRRSAPATMAAGPLRRMAAAMSALALAGTMTACGSDDGSGGSGDQGGNAAKNPEVQKAMQPTTEYLLPDEPLNPGSLKGKTVYYIPLNQQIPAFIVTAQSLKEAAALVGMKLQVCGGGNNPSQVSGCVDQAVGARAGAIITDAIPYGMAQNSLDKAVAGKIPVLVTNQIIPRGKKSSTQVAYLPGPTDHQEKVTRWAIADSGGSANVIISMLQDSPSTISYVQDYAVPLYTSECKGCKVAINKVSAANFQRIAPTTSAALLQNPAARYMQVEFEDILQPTLDALRQAGRDSSVKVAVSAVTTSALENLKTGGPVKAALIQHTPYEGWAALDLAMRQMLGLQPEEYQIPVRLITADNIGQLKITSAAQASGEWFGTPSYKDGFKKLWKVS